MEEQFLNREGTQVLAGKIKENAQYAEGLTDILNRDHAVNVTLYDTETAKPAAIDFANGVVTSIGASAYVLATKKWYRCTAIDTQTLAITWEEFEGLGTAADLEREIEDLQADKNDKITATADSTALSDTTNIAGVSAGANPVSIAVHALSKFWTYISGKLTGAISTVLTSNLTASRAVISNANGKLAVSDVTSTQLGYLSGATSNIQTQLNGKQASGSYKTVQTAKSDPTASGTTITAIDTISQNAQGVITATKKTIRSATTSQTGVVQLDDTLTSTSTALALTANQGRVLNNAITTISNKTTDMIVGKWFPVSQSAYSNGMDLSAYVNSQLDSGYKFLCWTNVSSSGWVMPKPVYIANSLNPAGYPYYDASTVAGQVDFSFLEIKA